jgi:hypothetical protein
MAIETERFQVVVSEADIAPDGALAVLIDTATGRSWVCTRFVAEQAATWRPMAFAADAPAAPADKPKRKPARRATRGRG